MAYELMHNALDVDVAIDIFAIKELDYVMMLMITYGCLQVKSGQKESTRDHEGNVKNSNVAN